MNKMRFPSILLLCLDVFLCLGVVAYAEPSAVDSGTCGLNGDNLTWALYGDRELVIAGTGEMADYDFHTAPWNEHRFKATPRN